MQAPALMLHIDEPCYIYMSTHPRNIWPGGGVGGAGMGSWACVSARSCEAGPGAGVIQKLCGDSWCLSPGGAIKNEKMNKTKRMKTEKIKTTRRTRTHAHTHTYT